MADTYVITIAGEVKEIQTGWSISETVNGRSQLSCAVLSKDGSYRPAIGAEIIFTKNNTRIFAGFINTPAEQGIGKGYTIITRFTAVDYNALADRRFVQNGGFPAGYTLGQALHSLVGWLAPYGVYLARNFSGSQVQLFIQQAEYYRYLSEGDSRLVTFFYGSTLNAYNAKMAALKPNLQAIIAAMPLDEHAALQAGHASALGWAPKQGFVGSLARYFIQQAEFYRYVADESDPRLTSVMGAADLANYAAVMATRNAALDAIISAMPFDELQALFNGKLAAEEDYGFSGTNRQFLIQQAEFYRWMPEGDPRLLTFFYPSTLAAYEAVMGGAAEDDIADVVAAMAPADLALLQSAYATAVQPGPAHDFRGTEVQFYIQQAEYYRWLFEDDPRLLTFFGSTSLAAYNLLMSGTNEDDFADILAAMAPDESASFSAAYADVLQQGQVDGAILPLLGYDVRSISSILDELSVITGFIWEIDYNKQLRMYAVGDITAPFDVTTAARVVVGDPTVESERFKFATRIVVRAGSGTVLVENERHLGNGVSRRFALDAHAAQLFGVVNIYRGGVFEQGLPVGVYGTDDLPWTFDSSTNELVQRADQAVLANTVDYIEQTYNGAFPISVVADSGAAPEDLVERVVDAPEVFSKTVAQAIANGELARALDVSQTVRYSTFRTGLHAGQTQTITIPERALSGSFLITDVETNNPAADIVSYTVTATGGSHYHGSYRDTLKSLGGGGSGASASGSVTVVGAGVTGSGTANRLSKWISATLLSDSIISELGTIATVNGSLTAINTVTASLFTGSGANLTSLPAEQLTGNMPWSVLPLGVGTWTGSPTITGALTVNSQVSVNDTITTPPLTNLTVSPTGDLVLDPSGNDVLPGTGYDINLGMLSKKYLTVHAAELWVETLVAQNTLATIGGRILVAPTNILALDLAPADTIVTVKYNNFAVGDILYMEANGQVEFMTVTAVVGTAEVPWLISGSISLLFSPPAATYTAYTYSVTRNTDGSGANQWYAGDALLNTGQVGNGFIDLYSVRGVKSGSEAGPTIVGNVRTSTSFNGWAPRWAIGNLNGLYGYGATTYGSAFGDPSGANVTVDATNGVRNRIGTTVYSQLTGSTFTIGLIGGNRMQWDGTNLTVVSSTVSIDSGGVSIATPGTSYATSFSYKFTPNATIGGSTWGVFGKNADTANRYLGIQNVVTTNSKNAWIELLATGRTSGADVNASFSLFSDGAVTGVSSASISATSINLTGSVNAINSMSVQGSGGLSVNYALTVGAGATTDPLLVQVNGTNKCRFDSNGDLRPETDSTQHVGVPSKRFAYMTALSFNTTDVGLENGWSLTESYRIGVSEPGVGLVDDEGQLVAFFGKEQTYLKTIADVNDLPFAVTTLDERIHMDPTPEIRVKDYDADGNPIFKTADDVVAFPSMGDIQSNKHRNNLE